MERVLKLCSVSTGPRPNPTNLASGVRNKYTIDYLTNLIEKEESEDNFLGIIGLNNPTRGEQTRRGLN